MKKLLLFLFLLAFVNIQCKKKRMLQNYIGEYTITSEHISGLYTSLDSNGFGLETYVDTSQVIDSLLTISESNTSNTLIIDGLIKGLRNPLGDFYRKEVEAVIEGERLVFVHDVGSHNIANIIRGHVWKQGDSIFLDYSWNHTGYGTIDAIPNYGKVKGKGSSL